MPQDWDAHGQALMDYFRRGSSYYAIERDDGLIDIRDTGQYFTAYRSWPLLDKKVLSLAKGRVLDLGCGAGRHSLYLQNKGFNVTGIDSSPLAIEVRRSRGLKKASVADIGHLDYEPSSFDTILLMGNGFGLLGSEVRGRRLLKHWHPLLSKGGTIIAEANNLDMSSSPILLAYQQSNLKRGRMVGQLRIRIRYREFRTRWFDLLMASKEDTKEIVQGSGWRVKKFIDGKGSYYGVVLQKEGD